MYIRKRWNRWNKWDGCNIRGATGETWEECERKVKHVLSEKLDTKDVVIKHARRVKAYGNEKRKTAKSHD